jgi:RNA polymerase sigma factor (sigma-70 family)
VVLAMMATPNTLDYEPLVLTLVRRAGGNLPGVLTHEDLAQQARLQLLELARRWEPERAPFPAFVQGHLGWALGRYVRKCDPNRRSPTVRVDTVDRDDLDGVGADHSHEQWAARVDCRAILAQLSPEHRSVLWMHHAEGYTIPQIATVLDITPVEAEALLKRAMRAARAITAGRLPLDDEADTATLLEALHEGAGVSGRLPGRDWVCERTGLSELRVSRLMRVLVAHGVIVGRGPRQPGYLAERGGGNAA